MPEWPPEHEPLKGSISARFKEERERIVLSQKELAKKLSMGAQRLAWIESSAGEPLVKFKSGHWSRMASLGMDIQYIMIGKRSMMLSENEAILLENYRACSQENQDHLEAVSAAFKEQDLAGCMHD